MANKTRLKLLLITPEMFLEIFKNKLLICDVENPLPEDVEMVRWNHNTRYNLIEIVITSKTFEPLKEDAKIPIIESPTFTRFNSRWVE